MKRVLCLLLCSCLFVSLASCGNRNYDDGYYDGEIEYDNYDYVDVTDYDITVEPLYQELYPEYVYVLDNIDHDEDTYQKFLDAFDIVYRNYDYMYSLFSVRGLKTKEEFIREDMIENLRDEINTISNSTWDGEPVDPEWIIGQVVGDHIYIADEGDEVTVVHEISHCNMVNTDDTPLYYLLNEGAAVFSEQFCSNTCWLNTLSPDENSLKKYNGKTYFIRGISHGMLNYILYGKCYSTLVCLVDLDIINRVKDEGDQSYIENYLRDNYGEEAVKLLDYLKAATGYGYEEDYDNPGIIKNLIEAEKLVNYCFNQSIINAEDADELKAILDLRCYYNKQLATRELLNYKESADDSYDSASFTVALDSELDPYGVDSQLYKKCMDFGMLNLDDNDLGRKAFNMLIGYNSNSNSAYSYNEARTITDASICISKDGKYLTVFHNDVPWTQYDLETGFPRIDYLEISKKAVDTEIKPLVKA